MKIFANNKVYIQKNDLIYLLRSANNSLVPSSIIDNVFGQIFIVTDSNRYEFVEFYLPEEVEFFNSCDWIVNYNDFDYMSEEEIVDYGCKINEQRNKIAQAYNDLPEEEKKVKYEEVSTQIELLEYKMWSVRDVLWYKQRNLKFDLPEGTNVIPFKKKNGIKKVLSIFKKK